MDGRLAIVRATHLNDYISVLREIGAPVDRDLARSKLPPRIEETPDLYVSVPVAIEWIARTGHDIELMELGLLGAQKASLASLRPNHKAAIITAQTGLRRLEALIAMSRLEDSAVQMHIRYEADEVRVICNMAGLGRHPFVCLAEWLNLQGVISVIRSVAGPLWCPGEMSFASTHRVPEAVRAAFANTRILMGQPDTSVVVGRADLARLIPHVIPAAGDPLAAPASGQEHDIESAVWEFASLLRNMVKPYLNEGRPDVAFAAELAGISTRTLQRRLMLCGSSYSQILQEARFELACTRLDDPALKVIDVAMMTGYGSPQHFTRAFRRFGGITPSEYRLHSFGGDSLVRRAVV
ncbi:MAG: helix-turn-helix domain-containing protein [Haliea sp.]|nr:helix-turn-helix domain-containing protein [Haliea sp.]